MCQHNGEFDDPMTGQCVICASAPVSEEHTKRGKTEYSTQSRNKTRWRADANIDLRKIEKVISLCRSLVAELTELGIGPVGVKSVDQAGCFFDAAGSQFFFTQDGGLVAVGCRALIKTAKGFSVGTMAKAVKSHLERTAADEDEDTPIGRPARRPRILSHCQARNLSPDLKDTVMAGRQDELAYLEAILETVENAGMAKCSLCGKPQAKENTFICFSCIPFDDGK